MYLMYFQSVLYGGLEMKGKNSYVRHLLHHSYFLSNGLVLTQLQKVEIYSGITNL